jgi:hypothetical protein
MSNQPGNVQIMVSLDGGQTWNLAKIDYSVQPPVIAAPPSEAPAPKTGTAAEKRVGSIIPLYRDPDNSTWTQVASIAKRFPAVHTVAIINPNDGPGKSKDDAYVNGIRMLRQNGVTVIGYVLTAYGGRQKRDVQDDIDHYYTWYPEIDGIFFDEVAEKAGKEQYYADLVNYVKEKKYTAFTVSNPGLPTFAESYVSQNPKLDVTFIYESNGYPSVSSIKKSWQSKYGRNRFGVIPLGLGTNADQARNFVQQVVGSEKIVGYVYCQTDKEPNPWDSLSPLTEVVIKELDNIIKQESGWSSGIGGPGVGDLTPPGAQS